MVMNLLSAQWSAQNNLFGPFHLISIAAGALVLALYIALGRKCRSRNDEGRARRVMWASWAFLTVNAVVNFANQTRLGGFHPTAIPFHVCTMMIYMLPIFLCLKRESRFKDSLLGFMAYVNLFGVICYMVMPQSAITPDYIMESLLAMSFHLVVLGLAAFMLIYYRVGEKGLGILNLGYLAFIALILFSALLNALLFYGFGIDSNFFMVQPGADNFYPVFNLIMPRTEPYALFVPLFIVYYAIGVYGMYFVMRAVKRLAKRS